MKLLILSVAIACQLSPLASRAVCQESRSQPERLHFAVSFPQGHKVLFELTATSAQRVLSSSVLQLTGDVEVRMTTCPPQGHVCVTSPMVLHADAVAAAPYACEGGVCSCTIAATYADHKAY
jgi:hypothetical protein